ncbi:MAG: hypothetical protein LBS73_01900, partial [Campylobacteraceae bacterium]|nr:hypothetical protein [Campylobacteraceae bacterium]
MVIINSKYIKHHSFYTKSFKSMLRGAFQGVKIDSLSPFCKKAFLKPLVFLLGFVFLLSSANAVNINNAPLAFDCSKLYIAQGTATTTTAVFEYDPDTNTKITKYTRGGDYAGGTFVLSTMALGPDSSGVMTAYHWYYGATSTIMTLKNGMSSATGYGLLAAPSNNHAGGEVNQLTGEIYMTGGYADNFIDQKMTIYDPSTQTSYAYSFAAAPGTTAFSNSYGMSSDMAIDAEGNAYVIASSGNAAGSQSWLVRLERPKNPDGSFSATGTMKYSRISQLNTAGLTGYPASTGLWGFAFYNGKVYLSNSAASAELYEIDPLSGAGTTKLTNQSGYMTDLAACQVAPVLRGKIYNDANGNGQIDSGEDVINDAITLEIYNSAKQYLGSTNTSNGEYSFLLNSAEKADSVFYVRVRNPKIAGVNAAQTWASGGYLSDGKGKNNIVTNYCSDFTSDDTLGSANSRACYGARVNGIDINAVDSGLANSNFYSKIVVNTSIKVSNADFAFSTIHDKSDAPASYDETAHNVAGKLVYLGADVSVDASSKMNVNASGDEFDDGMFVAINAEYFPLQNTVLVRGKNYNFRADINGSLKNNAYLNAWIGLSGGA